MKENEAENNSNGKKLGAMRSLEVAALIFSTVSSLIVISLVVFKGGALQQQVIQNTEDIRDIKAGGSPSLRETVRALSLEVESRKEGDAISNKRVDDLRVDFLDRMSRISGLLQDQIEQQTALIALIRAQQQTAKP